MKNILLTLLFITAVIISIVGQKGCEIDTIYYREFSSTYVYQNEHYGDVDSMIQFGKPSKNWIVIYKDNKIHKRILGNTFGGNDRIETYFYNKDGRLDYIEDTGSFQNKYKFNYDESGRLSQINSSSILGKSEEFFEYRGDEVTKISFNQGTKQFEEFTTNIQSARKYAFKFGNIDILTDTYFLAGNSNDAYGYKEEFKYDQCKNKILYVEKNPEANIILTLQVLKYVYKK